MELPDWRSVVTEPREVLIFEALEDPQWEWRTLDALGTISGMSRDEVRGIVAKYPVFARKSQVPGQSGQDLYTLQSRYYERQNPIQKAWGFLSGPSSSSST